MFSLFRKKKDDFFSPEEKEKILSAIQKAEQATSGEIRVFVENRCRFVDAIDRATEVFYGLKMEQTAYRNATLVYVALKDRQMAVFGDEGIYAKTGKEFWNEAVKKMIRNFNKENYAQGIMEVVEQIGAALAHHFPYDASTDKNELPDDIVFGK
ncbi:MAG TPA: TPM domain-containing protein [Chitinophagaceae bacterium]|nr:TPM domain-containing protein [Chitinophagaceae bacterium]